MRPWIELLPALVAALSPLRGQLPEPVCGHPALSRLDPAAAVTIPKGVSPADNPTFLIREHAAGQSLIRVEFYLLHSDAAFEIYGEVAEVDSGRVDSSAVAQLVVTFRDRTLPGSVNPELGIQALAEDVFGAPPDIDHNGKVYILLIDVRDDFDPDSSDTFLAGYFDPLDQRQQGNLADIIYLDSNPGLLTGSDISQALTTLAHEYQHLIHYGRDSGEALWVNEGLSELAPTLMGLPHRDFSLYLANTNVRLDSFDGAVADYARCGLFFTYAWVQLGTQFVRDLIATTQTGVAGVGQVLSAHQQPGMDTFVANWHRANFLQGDGVDGYGGQFALPQPAMHDVVTRFPQNGFQRDVLRLGAFWVLITGGENLFLLATRSAIDPAVTLINGTEGVILLAPQLFTTGYHDPAFGTNYTDLLVLATASSAVESSVSYTLFIDAEGGFEEVSLSYDGNTPADEMRFIQLGDGAQAGEAATEFFLTEGLVQLAAVEFITGGSDAVTLTIYGAVLSAASAAYEAVIPAPLGRAWTTHRLPPRIGSGRGFRGRVYVGLRSADNALGYNEHLATSHSYYQPPGMTRFAPLTESEVDGEFLTGNWSIRLSYLVPDTSSGELVIPLIVGNFYPNPVAGSRVTQLDVTPGREVELVLYNLLGQEIRRITRHGESFAPLFWDGRMGNGAAAPSGIYLGRVAAGSQGFTRKIVLVR
ncbi:MAG: T9SS type A sorting domain-containing protein [Candidatus Marinimicrobia bacterium]|nr:T9SS type A sorting domain-containing protein [Candidatus Neomarinimicrobiota bacterium]